MLQNFGNIICNMLFNCNLAGFCKRLAEYTAHNLVTLLRLAYRIGAVEQYCRMV